LLTRPERIRFLLEHYYDVVAGVRDRAAGDAIHLPLMCAAWNRPKLGYPELERLRLLMRGEAPMLYKGIVAVYMHPRFVRRAVCSKCGKVGDPHLVGELHRHPHRKSAAYAPRMVRVPLFPVEPRQLEDAVVWLDERWRDPGPYLPDELLPLVSAA
jgi:hypothetical protein